MTKKGTLVIRDWIIDIDDNLMTSGEKMMKFSIFKEYMMSKHPNIVGKFKIKSYLTDDLEIKRMVAWDSVVESAIKEQII